MANNRRPEQIEADERETPETRRAAILAMRKLASRNKLRSLKIRKLMNEGRR